MFIDHRTKEMATLFRVYIPQVRSGLINVFDNSIAGISDERIFLKNLITNISNYLNGLSLPGINFSCRPSSIHGKPIVKTQQGNCELGDLLVVVKYHLPDNSYEAKSIIYQIKLAKKVNSSICDIDQTQLNLLCDWPPFLFGKKATGGPQNYTVTPLTLEFGSFMLEPRSPAIHNYLQGKLGYGICPHALLVRLRLKGPQTVDINSFPYTRGDVSNFISHLAFEIGEHHTNPGIKSLIDALYRYVEWEPDPPGEFDDFFKESDEDGFAILEIKIQSEHKNEFPQRHRPHPGKSLGGPEMERERTQERDREWEQERQREREREIERERSRERSRQRKPGIERE